MPIETRCEGNLRKTASPTFLTGIESTYLPLHDVDLIETTGHDRAWREDVAALPRQVQQIRYPVRWHRVEPEPGHYDWTEVDRALYFIRERGISPIADLLHHTSYPRWLSDGLRDRRFGDAFARYSESVAVRYPWLEAYTLFNEPLATMMLAGHEGLWPPYDRGVAGFARLALNVLPALVRAGQCWRDLLPDALHIWVDTGEAHAAHSGAALRYADLANDRRHAVLDLVLGHDLNPSRPFLHELLMVGAKKLFELDRLEVDVLGLDYYPHSEWWYDGSGGHAPSPNPVGFTAIAEHYAKRYKIDMMLTETNIRGLPSDRVSWLRYTLQQYELATARGVPLRGYCWYPFVDSTDWDSLLARPAGRIDPVGVLSLNPPNRVRTHFTAAWEAAASGVRWDALPAYRFQPSVEEDLAGFLPQMGNWPWTDPPTDMGPAVSIPNPPEPSPISGKNPRSEVV